ncbi:MAG: hypothetical protein NVSMB31_17990 [Vulcanimicrobiaceae bacterium]
MPVLPKAPAICSNVRARVSAERVALLYQNGISTISTSLGVAALLVYLMWGQLPHAHVELWASIFCAVTIARFFLVGSFFRNRERVPAALWQRLFELGALAAGISWGLCALWLFPAHSVDLQLFLVFVMMGLAAGAASSLSPILSVDVLFLLPTILPSALRMLAQPSTTTHVGGLMALLFCIAMLVIALNNHRLIDEALGLRFTNADLARELELLATRDSLTGLPNRLIFNERLETAIKRASRNRHEVALMFIDCDKFKSINDTYGHKFGDEYLKHIATILGASVRSVDTVARMGGDEFVILLEECGDKATVEMIAERLFLTLWNEFQIGAIQIHPMLSVGISCFPSDASDPEGLLRQADEAMYRAKQAGGNSFAFYAEPLPQAMAI